MSAEDKSDNGELDLEGIDENEIEKVCVLWTRAQYPTKHPEYHSDL